MEDMGGSGPPWGSQTHGGGVPAPHRGCLMGVPPPGGLLYPFGPEVGDEATPREDDGMSPEIFLWETFSFYGKSYRSVYVGPGPHGVEGQGGAMGWGHHGWGPPWLGDGRGLGDTVSLGHCG